MATLPNLHHTPASPLSVDELATLAGTPEFEAEYRRQMAAIAEHDRSTHDADRMPVDWDALDSWE
jgi:hypothetical protein